MKSTTQRTLKWLRDEGAIAGVVEYWNPHAGRRIDLFNMIDIVAVLPSGRTLMVQSTSGTNHAHRITKAMENEVSREVLARLSVATEPAEALVVSWAKRGPRGKRKLWTPRVTPFLPDASP
jgi:hypothetical protein